MVSVDTRCGRWWLCPCGFEQAIDKGKIVRGIFHRIRDHEDNCDFIDQTTFSGLRTTLER